MSNIFRVTGVVVAVAIGWGMGLVADGHGKEAKWAGERSMENGVEVVRNPAAPQFGVVNLDLRETAAIHHGENEQDVFLRIKAMAVAPDNSLYALDARQCAVYRFDGNGAFKGRFGKKGEGPGDFKYPSDLAWGDNGCLHVLDDAIISSFSPEGDLLEQFKLPNQADVFCPLSGGGFIVSGMVFTEKESGFAVAHHDGRDGRKELFRVMNKKITGRQSGKKYTSFFVQHEYEPPLALARAADGGCAFGYGAEYAMQVFDGAGTTRRKIIVAEKPIKINEAEKKNIYDHFATKLEAKWTKAVLQEAVQFPAHRPFFNRILADGQGRLFVFRVESVLTADKNGAARADLFGRDGRFLQEVRLPFAPDLIHRGTLYRIHEDPETGDIAIRLYRVLNWAQLKE